jgi:hypothetical protein
MRDINDAAANEQKKVDCTAAFDSDLIGCALARQSTPISAQFDVKYVTFSSLIGQYPAGVPASFDLAAGAYSWFNSSTGETFVYGGCALTSDGWEVGCASAVTCRSPFRPAAARKKSITLIIVVSLYHLVVHAHAHLRHLARARVHPLSLRRAARRTSDSPRTWSRHPRAATTLA